jgi:VanZ family protein
MAHKTSAWPMAQAYAALIVYASLYPFTGWHDQGLAPWMFLWSSLPKYWVGFDVGVNIAGYVPLGFLLALSFLRRGSQRFVATSNAAAMAVAGLTSAALSLAMETFQSFLPLRVPSNVDLALNVLGALAGAGLAVGLELAGAIDRWSHFRVRWFVPSARGALVLLTLWPFALLFPPSVPLGLGHIFERLEAALAQWLMDTPFLAWLPVREVELQPLVPGVELVCVSLGALIPCLLAHSVVRTAGRRVVFAFGIVGVGIAATALSAALSWGPSHAWAWLSMPVQLGLLVGLLLALMLVRLPARGCAAVALLIIVVHLSLLNQAPASDYFAQTLKAWEQGRFIRFHGLGQWLGWIWPYATLAYVLVRVSRSDAQK